MKTINTKDKPAQIIRAVRKVNEGLVVTPTEYLGFHEGGSKLEMDGELWMCIITDHYWRVHHPQGQIETMFGLSKIAFCPDSWLRPLEPVKEDIGAEAGAEA